MPTCVLIMPDRLLNTLVLAVAGFLLGYAVLIVGCVIYVVYVACRHGVSGVADMGHRASAFNAEAKERQDAGYACVRFSPWHRDAHVWVKRDDLTPVQLVVSAFMRPPVLFGIAGSVVVLLASR